jgi:hypothetical protein
MFFKSPPPLAPSPLHSAPVSKEREQQIVSELAGLDRDPLGKAVMDVLEEQIRLTLSTVLDPTVTQAEELFRRSGRLESLEQFRATLLQLQARGRK